jgi:hypothetical protein
MSRRPPRDEGHRRRLRRQLFDDLFPTAVRYAGFVLIIYAAFVDQGKNPALIPAATGMIFFKTVYAGGGKD